MEGRYRRRPATYNRLQTYNGNDVKEPKSVLLATEDSDKGEEKVQPRMYLRPKAKVEPVYTKPKGKEKAPREPPPKESPPKRIYDESEWEQYRPEKPERKKHRLPKPIRFNDGSTSSGSLEFFNHGEFVTLYDQSADPVSKLAIIDYLYNIFIRYIESDEEVPTRETFGLMLADEGYMVDEYDVQKTLVKVAAKYDRKSFERYTKDLDYYTNFIDTFGFGLAKLLDLDPNMLMATQKTKDVEYLNLPLEYYITIVDSLDVDDDIKTSILEDISEESGDIEDDIPFVLSVNKLISILEGGYLTNDQITSVVDALRALED